MILNMKINIIYTINVLFSGLNIIIVNFLLLINSIYFIMNRVFKII